MIKRIGTEARQDLERFFDTKVFLDLRVKVNPDWRNDERTLDELGVPKGPAASRTKAADAPTFWNFSRPPTEYPVSTSKQSRCGAGGRARVCLQTSFRTAS